jgi:soluble lytic murein transglycosylase-like protein
MRQYKSEYARRGEIERRRARLRNGALAVVACGIGVAAFAGHRPPEARAAEQTPLLMLGSSDLRNQLDETRGKLDLATAQLERMQAVFAFSTRYHVAADIASAIYDVALAEGIEPELAFRLVKVESEFNERALSPVGAVGLTQVMPATARFFVPGITRDQLYDRETNLRCGLRYLRALVRENHGNMKLALLIYNRGETAVNESRHAGLDPSNGYEQLVMKGYKGKGVID